MGKNVRAKFKPDYKAFAEFATSDQILEPVHQAAHDVRELAAADAPKQTGALAEGYKVDAGAGILKIGKFVRVIVNVVNENPAAAPNEFGGKRNNANHTLGKAGAMIGDFRGSLPDD